MDYAVFWADLKLGRRSIVDPVVFGCPKTWIWTREWDGGRWLRDGWLRTIRGRRAVRHYWNEVLSLLKTLGEMLEI
jgi:hypothetical protein